MQYILKLNQFYTVCPGSRRPAEKMFDIFASEKWGFFICYDIIG